jgi:hypothetical protein
MEHRCPFAPNPFCRIQWYSFCELFKILKVLGVYYFIRCTRRARADSLTCEAWLESHWQMGPPCDGARVQWGQVRDKLEWASQGLALDINDTHAACLGISGRARTEHALDINGRHGCALGISGPLYRYTSVHRENTLTKSYIRMVLGHLHIQVK